MDKPGKDKGIAASKKDRLRKMLNIDLVGVMILNESGTLIDANKAFCKILGYNRKDIDSGRLSWQALTPPAYREISEKQMENLRKTGRIGPYEKEYIRKDGLTSWMLFVGAQMEDGTIIEYCIDISDRKDAEHALHGEEISLMETRNLLTMATEASLIGWGTWDLETGNMMWDERGREIIGLDKAEDHVESWLDRIHPEDRPSLDRHVQEAIARKSSFDLIYRIMLPDGKIRHVHGTGMFYDRPGSNSVRGTGLVRDITRQIDLQQQKDYFLAIVSHELKTPLSVLKGYAEMFEAELKEKQEYELANYLVKINEQVVKITTLINDLLDVSRIEVGRLELQSEIFDFDELVNDVVNSMQYVSFNRLTRSGNTGKKIRGDRERIGQVIINFVSNAMKFSPDKSEIVISTSAEKDQVILSVEDNGIGISREDQEKVFERFSDINSGSGKYNKGLGIGLYLSAQIIDRQQGRIWVDSEEGKGSKFSFSLPVAKE